MANLIAAQAHAEGDPSRGRALVASRTVGMCLLCHQAPIAEERFQGDIGPNLARIGARLTQAELRARIANAASLNPNTVMPTYNAPGTTRTAPAFAGKPILTDTQIDDIAAYLATLK